ncbi:N-acetyl sugar amidotransferase [Flavobacterium sp. ZT3R18]|uniref:N-acetyl sugar amidotransferase n=1 Tax=Flavobacterium sp. ZT3R18 TaxID=2594429 RepID=UPI00117B79FE|nr:N-acetyl sugar amidotransferase [Flavobacterium sp. ZT3R18]TRX34811.1 N-acetyl sugar amidotransferase [Flavobacterium sp. ZT3R18]
MIKDSGYKICNRCIMDTTDSDIVFDEQGICNHCKRAETLIKERTFEDLEERERKLLALVEKIKTDGKGKKYDCVIGVSGGVDSTYVAYEVLRLGLKPLAIHLDNGWNSELAVSNIEKTLNNLGIDLFTYVIDWEEFKDLQLAFLKASTPDGEVPTDHAIISILYKMASKYNVKYILNGVNFATESILPLKWGYGYYDYKYISAVQKKFGEKKIKTYPHFGLVKLFYYMKIKKIKFVPFLDYVDYKKADAMEIIQSKLGWVYYGGKHYESIYTRFFQAYILPNKFNIDKRKGHLSSLIVSNQITRSEALEELNKAICEESMLKNDYEYTLKKFGLTKENFDAIMKSKTKTFEDYPNQFQLFEKLKKVRNRFKI